MAVWPQPSVYRCCLADVQAAELIDRCNLHSSFSRSESIGDARRDEHGLPGPVSFADRASSAPPVPQVATSVSTTSPVPGRTRRDVLVAPGDQGDFALRSIVVVPAYSSPASSP